MPSGDGSPGAEEAGVADYIDGFLGAFSFDPPRIWAGGPTSGRKGGGARVRRTSTACGRLDELAWRMRIEGSQGRPEREFNGPVVGSAAALPGGAGGPRRRLPRGGRRRAAPAARGRRRVPRICCGSTAAKACTAHPSTAATATAWGGRPSATKATYSHAATATPRCRSRDCRRHRHRLGPRGLDSGRGADPRRLVGGHHGEGTQPPPRPRRPHPACGGLLQRRDQVPLALLPRARPAGRAPRLPAICRRRRAHPRG